MRRALALLLGTFGVAAAVRGAAGCSSQEAGPSGGDASGDVIAEGARVDRALPGDDEVTYPSPE